MIATARGKEILVVKYTTIFLLQKLDQSILLPLLWEYGFSCLSRAPCSEIITTSMYVASYVNIKINIIPKSKYKQ